MISLESFVAFSKASKWKNPQGVGASRCTASTPPTTSQGLPTEEAFDRSIRERFQEYIEFNLRFTVEEPYGKKIPLDIEYIRLPSTSIPIAREHFRRRYDWPAEYERNNHTKYAHYDMRHELFVVIDEETTNSLLLAPSPISDLPSGLDYEEATAGEDAIVVKIVDAHYDEACEGIIFAAAGRHPKKGAADTITFYGYQKTTPRWLRTAWLQLMDDDFDMIFHGEDKVYKG